MSASFVAGNGAAGISLAVVLADYRPAGRESVGGAIMRSNLGDKRQELPFEMSCSSDWTQSYAKLQPRALERVFPTHDYGAGARDPRAGAGTQIENRNEHQ